MSAGCSTPASLVRFLLSVDTLPAECIWQSLLRVQVPSPALETYLGVFLLTCALEAPLYALALRRLRGGWLRRMGWIVVINLATHPFVYFALSRMSESARVPYYQYLCSAEIFAPAVESLLLWQIGVGSLLYCLGFAASANLISWWAGVFLAG